MQSKILRRLFEIQFILSTIIHCSDAHDLYRSTQKVCFALNASCTKQIDMAFQSSSGLRETEEIKSVPAKFQKERNHKPQFYSDPSLCVYIYTRIFHICPCKLSFSNLNRDGMCHDFVCPLIVPFFFQEIKFTKMISPDKIINYWLKFSPLLIRVL